MQTRTLQVLTGNERDQTLLADSMSDPEPSSDIGRIVYAFRQWRGAPQPRWWDERKHGPWSYRDTPGFTKAATIEEIGKHGFVLTPVVTSALKYNKMTKSRSSKNTKTASRARDVFHGRRAVDRVDP